MAKMAKISNLEMTMLTPPHHETTNGARVLLLLHTSFHLLHKSVRMQSRKAMVWHL